MKCWIPILLLLTGCTPGEVEIAEVIIEEAVEVEQMIEKDFESQPQCNQVKPEEATTIANKDPSEWSMDQCEERFLIQQKPIWNEQESQVSQPIAGIMPNGYVGV